MDWQQFLQIVAGPAFLALATACAWGYIDLRSSIRFLEKDVASKRDAQETKLDATSSAMAVLQLNLTNQMHTFMVEIMKAYVPKEEVLRLEKRIMEALREIHTKLDRQAETK
jgi:hypothetical protein